MNLPQRDAHKIMLKELAVTRGRVHKIYSGQEACRITMQRVRMLERRATWMRENAFDKIEAIADRDEETLRHLHAGFDPELFYNGLYNPRRPPTAEELILDLKVEVEGLRMFDYDR